MKKITTVTITFVGPLLNNVIPSTESDDNVIDCDVAPYIPENMARCEHIRTGLFRWNPDKIGLVVLNAQENLERFPDFNNVGRYKLYLNVKKLLSELNNIKIVNANVLDYLLKNQHLIPDSWKGKVVRFWGTKYFLSSTSDFYVPCLIWHDEKWNRCLNHFEHGHTDPSEKTERCCPVATFN